MSKPSYGLSDDEVARMLQDGFATAQQDMQARALVEARVDADRMLMATESALQTDGDVLAADQRAAIDALIDALRASVGSEDAAVIEAATQALAKGHGVLRRRAHEPQHPAGPGRQERAIPFLISDPTADPSCPLSKYFPTPNTVPQGAEIEAPAGTSICEALLDNNIKIEHACDMSCACTTCHVVVKAGYNSLNEAEEEEEDLLDRAWGLQPQSRPVPARPSWHART